MLDFFKRNKTSPPAIQLVDLDGNALHTGDRVLSHRYDLGECIIEEDAYGFYYKSITSNDRVHWSRMVDAVTKRQKVEKL